MNDLLKQEDGLGPSLSWIVENLWLQLLSKTVARPDGFTKFTVLAHSSTEMALSFQRRVCRQ